jgi:hypothetical protein
MNSTPYSCIREDILTYCIFASSHDLVHDEEVEDLGVSRLRNEVRRGQLRDELRGRSKHADVVARVPNVDMVILDVLEELRDILLVLRRVIKCRCLHHFVNYNYYQINQLISSGVASSYHLDDGGYVLYSDGHYVRVIFCETSCRRLTRRQTCFSGVPRAPWSSHSLASSFAASAHSLASL